MVEICFPSHFSKHFNIQLEVELVIQPMKSRWEKCHHTDSMGDKTVINQYHNIYMLICSEIKNPEESKVPSVPD